MEHQDSLIERDMTSDLRYKEIDSGDKVSIASIDGGKVNV